MNPIKIILGLAVVAGIAVLAYTLSPALRSKVQGAVDGVAGWTEEARRGDPVGYVDYALEKLGEDLERFRGAKSSLAATKKGAQEATQRNDALHRAAVELSEALREQYQTAEAGGAYPVTVMGQSYDRDQLVSQVQLVLAQRDTYASAIDEFQGALAKLDETATTLESRLIETQKNITLLETKREVLRIEKLTADTETLLTKVDALLGENEELLADDPVRTVEELLQAIDATEASPEPDPKAEAMRFLEG